MIIKQKFVNEKKKIIVICVCQMFDCCKMLKNYEIFMSCMIVNNHKQRLMNIKQKFDSKKIVRNNCNYCYVMIVYNFFFKSLSEIVKI